MQGMARVKGGGDKPKSFVFVTAPFKLKSLKTPVILTSYYSLVLCQHRQTT